MALGKRATVNDAFAYEISGPTTQEKLVAEFVGTFFVVFTVGVSTTSGSHDPAVAIGLMLGAQIYTFGSVSGALLNPAVAVAVCLSGRNKLDGVLCACYAGAEILGGIIGAIIAAVVSGKTFCYDESGTQMDNAFSCFLLEAFYTMVLALVVLTSSTSEDTSNQYFGFAIGCAVIAGTKAIDGFDQGSLNPAVTIGINIVNYFNPSSDNNPTFLAWITFLFAPVLGACMASLVFWQTRSHEYALAKEWELKE